MDIDLTICGIGELPELKGKSWTHVVSIWEKRFESDPACREIIQLVAPDAEYHFAFFDDTADQLNPGAPQREDVERLLNFTRNLTSKATVLVHCQAGVSRSPAIAYAIVCQHSNPGQESKGMGYILSIRPMIFPNELIVEWADQLLERKGQMTEQLGYF